MTPKIDGATAEMTPPAITTKPAITIALSAPRRPLAGAIIAPPRIEDTRYPLVAQLR